jgi:prevent-host-death family protein
MTEPVRVPIRRLQQHASELIAEVQAGRRVEITRNGRLVAVLCAPDPEQAAWEQLVDSGAVDPAGDRLGGLAGWPTPRGTPSNRLSDALVALRDAEADR